MLINISQMKFYDHLPFANNERCSFVFASVKIQTQRLLSHEFGTKGECLSKRQLLCCHICDSYYIVLTIWLSKTDFYEKLSSLALKLKYMKLRRLKFLVTNK